jgi:hypothetical protein
MSEDSSLVVPPEVDYLDGLDLDQPTGYAELKIFLMPVSYHDKRGSIGWTAAILRRCSYCARLRRDHN